MRNLLLKLGYWLIRTFPATSPPIFTAPTPRVRAIEALEKTWAANEAHLEQIRKQREGQR